MRIAYVNKVDLDGTLPAVNFTLFNAYALAQAGADSFLFAQKRRRDSDLATVLRSFNLPARDRFHLVVYPRQRFLGIQTNQWFYLKASRAIKKLHRVQPFDAVISRDPGALPYLARLKRKTGISVFYQPHNFYVDLSVRPDVNPKNATKYHWLEKKFIPQMTGLLCLQESQAGWYRKYFPAQHVLVAKPGLMQLKPPQSGRYANRVIGYVGSLQLKKGVETLLQALRLLQDRGLRLVLVGGRNEEEIEPVRQRIQDLGLSDLVQITGWVPFSKVEEYLDQITVGVIPLQDTFYNRYLTAPNKLFDYLSRGIPIVAADLPAIRDFLDEGGAGTFFKSESADELASAIFSITSNQARYQRYAQNALLHAERYVWKERAEAMIALIQPGFYSSGPAKT